MLLAVSVIAFVCSVFVEFILNKPPFMLCLITRYTYLVVACSSIAALKINNAYMRSILLVIIFAALCLSFYHLGVENHWWIGPAKCTTNLDITIDSVFSVDPENIVRCDKVNWRIFGISVTLYNFCLIGFLFWIASLSLAIDSLKRNSEH
jgi:disulfide bond formation protein DsbB